jgi:hypothetical protein
MIGFLIMILDKPIIKVALTDSFGWGLLLLSILFFYVLPEVIGFYYRSKKDKNVKIYNFLGKKTMILMICILSLSAIMLVISVVYN